MARTKAADYDEKRNLIMEKAAQLFARDGFHPGAGLYAIFGEEIAAALG